MATLLVYIFYLPRFIFLLITKQRPNGRPDFLISGDFIYEQIRPVLLRPETPYLVDDVTAGPQLSVAPGLVETGHQLVLEGGDFLLHFVIYLRTVLLLLAPLHNLLHQLPVVDEQIDHFFRERNGSA